MKNKYTIAGILLVFVVIIGIYFTLNLKIFDLPNSDNQVACTMEAKQCPDGTYVSRTGPKCEFTKCPEVVNSSVGMGKTVIQNGLKITPIKVVEDSRCPAGVMCIQAGRLVVKTKFERVDGYEGTKELDIELGGSEMVLEKWVSFESASFVNDKNYSFTFVVKPLTR